MIKTLLIITALLSIFSIIASTENLSIVYAERDDEEDELSKRDVAVLCDASEDYEAHKEQCDKLYDKVPDATLALAEPNSKK